MLPAILKRIPPSQALQDDIREYQVFRFLFDPVVSPPVKFHAPRPEHCITFYIREAQKFSYGDSPLIFTYPSCVINGIYTAPIHRYGGNDFLAIKVVLQPSALYHLLRIPLAEITNKYLDAEAVWGDDVKRLSQRLSSLDSIDEMIRLIECFLETVLAVHSKSVQSIDKILDYLLGTENGVSIDWLANQSCLSVRQFSRKFEERTGISSKLFQRIIRFDKAFRMKNSLPHLDWLSIAVRCNYHDYQHLAKDFKEFTNLAPPAFFEQEKSSPERSFGLVEA